MTIMLGMTIVLSLQQHNLTMKFDTAFIDMANIGLVIQKHNHWNWRIHPITYQDDRNPRLPRKQSKQTDLQHDTNFLFKHAFEKINSKANAFNRYEVSIKLFRANDKLGKGDLDNYCKAILDGITSTGKIWLDDKQVDSLTIKRFHYSELEYSFIDIEVSVMV
jgi:Holliday junction resolvase RusA-like endonuclease